MSGELRVWHLGLGLSEEAEQRVAEQAKTIGFNPDPCSCDHRDPVLIAGDGVHLPGWWCAWCKHRIPDTKETHGD